MALILSLETATSSCSVALRNDGQLLGSKQKNIPNSHAASLFVFMEELMKEQGKSFGELKAIAISKGPGSYTGLRIGVSAAKGLCYSLGIPLIAVNTLQIIAGIAERHPLKENALLIPMIDARRMEVYAAVYSGFEEISPTQAVIVEQETFSHYLGKPCYFFGDGMPKCRELLARHGNAFFIDDIIPTAEALGLQAYSRFLKQQFEDTAYFEPYYLKEFVTQSTFHKK
jgi:tRNA threonylcarbamoyladenosine biosynthesis protein TsaB